MKRLVFAELTDGVSMDMLTDPNIHIISDGALFLITTEEHQTNYPYLHYEETDIATLKEYGELSSFLTTN